MCTQLIAVPHHDNKHPVYHPRLVGVRLIIQHNLLNIKQMTKFQNIFFPS